MVHEEIEKEECDPVFDAYDDKSLGPFTYHDHVVNVTHIRSFLLFEISSLFMKQTYTMTNYVQK